MQRMGLPSLTDNCQKQRTSQYHHLFDKKIMNQENSLNHWESNFYRARHGINNVMEVAMITVAVHIATFIPFPLQLKVWINP